jgi:tetratricopeptide (TPR) repeat protein
MSRMLHWPDRVRPLPVRSALWALLIGALLSVSFIARTRSKVWRSAEDFWWDVMLHAPSKARAYNNYAVALMKQSRYTEAVPALQQAIKLDRWYADPWNNLAMTYAQLGSFEEAFKALQEALRICPYHIEGYNNVASLLIAGEQYNEAERVLLHALSLRKHAGNVLYKLGNVAYLQGDLEKAYHYFKQCCTQADMDTVEGFSAWGRVSIMLKKHTDAIQAYKAAVALQADDELMIHLATAYLLNGQYDQAEPLFKSVHNRKPDNMQIILGLAEVYVAMRHYGSALKYYKKAELFAQQVPIILLRIAGCYFRLGNKELLEIYLSKFLSLCSCEQAMQEAGVQKKVVEKVHVLLDALQQEDCTIQQDLLASLIQEILVL